LLLQQQCVVQQQQQHCGAATACSSSSGGGGIPTHVRSAACQVQQQVMCGCLRHVAGSTHIVLKS
jgi:hypothetical protein